jgi:hypothetical protein
MRILLATCLLLCASWAQAQPPAAKPHLYGVVFALTTGEGGKLASVDVVKVFDPASGTTDPVHLRLPDEYIEAAHAFFRKKDYRKAPQHFYSYTWYDPMRPRRADIEYTSGQP